MNQPKKLSFDLGIRTNDKPSFDIDDCGSFGSIERDSDFPNFGIKIPNPILNCSTIQSYRS